MDSLRTCSPGLCSAGVCVDQLSMASAVLANMDMLSGATVQRLQTVCTPAVSWEVQSWSMLGNAVLEYVLTNSPWHDGKHGHDARGDFLKAHKGGVA